MSVSTGCPTLDTMLEGGYSQARAVLLKGTLGTGKKYPSYLTSVL